jgi:hypothetical protein
MRLDRLHEIVLLLRLWIAKEQNLIAVAKLANILCDLHLLGEFCIRSLFSCFLACPLGPLRSRLLTLCLRGFILLRGRLKLCLVVVALRDLATQPLTLSLFDLFPLSVLLFEFVLQVLNRCLVILVQL